MDEDEDRKKPTAHEVGMNLETMSAEELSERITLLREEIARLEAALHARRSSRDAAEGVFKL